MMLDRFARFALAAAFVLGAAAPAGAVAPFSFDSTPGRLPKTVVPADYRIALTPDAAAKTLRGTESVTLDVRRATSRIVFNTHDMRIADARLDGTPVARTLTENDKQLTTLTLARPAAAGRHVLTLAYSGQIEDSSDGLFAQNDVRKIDLLQIDTEGYDCEIIKMINFGRHKPAIIHFEHGLPSGAISLAEFKECAALLMDHGYYVITEPFDAIAYLPAMI